MSFGKIILGCFTLGVLILAVDLGLVYLADWQKRREARKWCLSPGAFKPVQRNWWEA